ncbi:6625_t:CDS:2 [Rhizophagus irregularis]|nr:6625_t:CDS:2 [Rhizophagus irregularis]
MESMELMLDFDLIFITKIEETTSMVAYGSKKYKHPHSSCSATTHVPTYIFLLASATVMEC